MLARDTARGGSHGLQLMFVFYGTEQLSLRLHGQYGHCSAHVVGVTVAEHDGVHTGAQCA